MRYMVNVDRGIEIEKNGKTERVPCYAEVELDAAAAKDLIEKGHVIPLAKEDRPLPLAGKK